ncbi:hypothetical protein DFJ58DRAFT_778573 [Suillus subalutaceus]|uniref:uncharacterized protein n=1 Tax=Suillus subalutaceus TaxID=48586 RepID=UPI001B871F72|nr:uncharacterized protein DFJ58DRAFT_778573 [Suillus subalutaceus]KAG1860704.1 hypothetical protein DFJ58DRAFT_778573 [Suillus subalutaceus]
MTRLNYWLITSYFILATHSCTSEFGCELTSRHECHIKRSRKPSIIHHRSSCFPAVGESTAASRSYYAHTNGS